MLGFAGRQGHCYHSAIAGARTTCLDVHGDTAYAHGQANQSGWRGRVTIEALLYGRDAERSRIGALLDGARASRSGVLVIRGEPGAGKSALLEDARERASGMQVLSGGGIESEAQLPFAALHQFVRLIVGDVETLPEPQAGAPAGGAWLEAAAGDDRFLVSLAV